jgi:hypothetical protein
MAIQEHPNRLSPLARRLWLLALVLYGAAALADIVSHLAADVRAGQSWRDPANLVVAFSAGLFWPVDLVAAQLLSR